MKEIFDMYINFGE